MGRADYSYLRTPTLCGTLHQLSHALLMYLQVPRRLTAHCSLSAGGGNRAYAQVRSGLKVSGSTLAWALHSMMVSGETSSTGGGLSQSRVPRSQSQSCKLLSIKLGLSEHLLYFAKVPGTCISFTKSFLQQPGGSQIQQGRGLPLLATASINLQNDPIPLFIL